MDFLIAKDTGCLPITTTISYTGNEVDKLLYYKYAWSPADQYTLDTIPPDTVPTITHTFTEEGQKNIRLILEDTMGCYSYLDYKDVMGYINEIVADTLICLGQEVQFFDFVRYYGDNVPYWNDPARPEKISWDFGDGSGFTTMGTSPIHTYLNKGLYTARMATNDEDGCVDTASINVLVGGVNAAMEDNSDEYLCDQIIQFLDSSYFDFVPTTDVITDYSWDFGDNTTKSYLKDPFHYYSSNGNFTITLAIKTEAGCIDTAYIPIYLKGPEPYFDIVSDTLGCVPYTATFTSKSKFTTSFIWKLGDANNTTVSAQSDTTFSFTYNEPGTYYVTLEGSDSFYNEASQNKYTCSAVFPDTGSLSQVVRRIVVLPIPEARFSFEEPACVGQPVLFKNESDTIYKILNWKVDTLDLTTTGDFYTSFNKPGTYDVLFTPTYIPKGDYQRECFDTFTNTITISDVKAGFTYIKQGACSEFLFQDSSTNAVRFEWNFDHPKSGDKNTSDLQNPKHRYGKDIGIYDVCQAVFNEQGCSDTVCKEIEVEYVKDIEKYNVFTPNGDGQNDEFLLEVVNHKVYELKIFNRWGERVFYTNNPLIGWNGKLDNVGKDFPSGTYYYVLSYQFNCESVSRLAEGLVDLIRD